ncbi:MAG: amidohydrolase [Rhodospirillales bacterium]|jgi:predicted TIM-barrel fold metal-dependent hydrolase|nr:amidohydrolase [Rhodospirillales bacterium]
MIVDCHYHVIQHWVGHCGHSSRELHMKYMQKMLTRTVAEAYRSQDGAKTDTRALFSNDDNGWSGLNDVSLRIGRNGQIEFSVDGEDYYIQYMPVGMQEMVAPPEQMSAQMTYAGVDHCILQAGGSYGAMNDFHAFTQNQSGSRVTGQMWVDEPNGGTPEGLAEIERAYGLGLRALFFSGDGFARYGFAWGLDDAQMDPLWAKMEELGIVLCIEVPAGPTYDKAGYIKNLLALGTVMDRFPGIQVHVSMGPPVQHFSADGGWNFPDEVLAVYRRDQLAMEVMFPITWGGRWDYPYPEAQILIRGMRDLFGAEKLMWGSDMPNVERFCTYRQSLEYLRGYCTFLAGSEMDAILGGNAVRIYGIGATKA